MFDGVERLPGGGARFQLYAPHARAVSLAGDFTRWAAGALPMAREGDLWRCVVPSLPLGLRAYKFIVDGHWHSDPHNAWGRPDGHGGWNSSFVIDPVCSLGGARALRVASLNLHTYQERDPVEKLRQAARAFAALDVHALALQEVGRGLPGLATEPNAGELIKAWLEELTGVLWWHWWRPAHLGFGRYEEGLSLLSRMPLQHPREYELSAGGLRRIALSAELEGPLPLRLVTLHSSWPEAGGEPEILRLLDQLGPTPPHLRGTLLAGDLNAGPHSRQLQRLRSAGFVDVGYLLGEQRSTFFGGHGPESGRIDYHLWHSDCARPIELLPLFAGGSVAGVPQPRVSDHLGLLGVYELNTPR